MIVYSRNIKFLRSLNNIHAIISKIKLVLKWASAWRGGRDIILQPSYLTVLKNLTLQKRDSERIKKIINSTA